MTPVMRQGRRQDRPSHRCLPGSRRCVPSEGRGCLNGGSRILAPPRCTAHDCPPRPLRLCPVLRPLHRPRPRGAAAGHAPGAARRARAPRRRRRPGRGVRAGEVDRPAGPSARRRHRACVRLPRPLVCARRRGAVARLRRERLGRGDRPRATARGGGR